MSHADHVIETTVPVIGLSDHYPVALTWQQTHLRSKNGNMKINHKTVKIRHMDKFDSVAFNVSLGNKLHNLDLSKNVTSLVQDFNDSILAVLNEQIPQN